MIYRIDDDGGTLTVLRVLHAARRWRGFGQGECLFRAGPEQTGGHRPGPACRWSQPSRVPGTSRAQCNRASCQKLCARLNHSTG
ncbi:type II toxin-antitoxin system RelE/ParE family toxin [Verminephrobacter eiseniae]|nr:type II toxin-antitoxin system RelE/ParE family toxin [Verminephrobacter eiseniae]MCW5294923.1 type II toxin-antitoxin system RelE/ParE family toxin [Verminephrobacter eiseniae]MCW8183804.1 type II toxin-antitoxin system RelE/ParE family toxin [Verminephrobacter eiseniae]MCW8222348.1 type II toxin-antitoxin system RelE/ParE family toxin [Verminephrobacter eiseniae]MCW8233945.1 type II toxin-antitoxin system RelE/ParE family toxin [Verminephrobacter eiseniae]